MALTSPASANVYSVDYINVDAHMYICIQHVEMAQWTFYEQGSKALPT